MAHRSANMGPDWHSFDEERFGPRTDYSKMVYNEPSQNWQPRDPPNPPYWTLDVDDWDKRYATWLDNYSDVPDLIASFKQRSRDSAPHRGHSCENCNSIPISKLFQEPGALYKLCDDFDQLRELSARCGLLEMIFTYIGPDSSSDHGGPISISVQMDGPHGLLSSPSVESSYLCIHQGSVTVALENRKGLTILPSCDSSIYFRRLYHWSIKCTRGHYHRQDSQRPHPWQRPERKKAMWEYYDSYRGDPRRLPYSTDTRLPSRVLDVGKPDQPDILYIRETGGSAVGSYIAVSHRWGTTDKQYQTTNENIKQRKEGFRYEELPQTFKDAVIVARNLGIQFLWIDSLCIKQDNEFDKETQLKSMEEIFASSFCTIAATSAGNCEDGFLHRSVENCIQLVDGSVEPPLSIYVTNEGNNFVHDVEEAELNGRAWVLQERALSRRTIHFAATQTYWECGSVTGCETIPYEDWERPSNPLSSSNFPNLESRDSVQDPRLVHSVFSIYSRLHLTRQQDKPSAISGLEYRLATTYRTLSVYGVFSRFFGESLLWKRAAGDLKHIVNMDKKIPSWSYMAYTGEICYNDIPSDGESQKGVFEFKFNDRCTLVAPLRTISLSHHVEPQQDSEYRFRGTETDLWGHIRYDNDKIQGDTHRLEYVMILKRPAGLAYGLIVKETGNGEYHRIGVISMNSEHIDSVQKEIIIV